MFGTTNERQLKKARKLRLRNRLPAALEIFRRLCNDDPHEVDLWLERAGVAEAMGATDEAGACYFHVADVFARLGLRSEAHELARQALEVCPNHSGARLFVRRFAPPTPVPARADIGSSEPLAKAEPPPAAAPPNATPKPATTEVADELFVREVVPEAVEQGFADIGGELVAGEPMSSSWLPAVPDVAALRKERLERTSDLDVVAALVAAVMSQPVLRKLDSDVMQLLLDQGHPIRLFEGDRLIGQGDSGRSLYILLRGEVAVDRLHSDGVSYRVGTLHQGAFIGELALITGAPRSASVRAVTDCVVFELPAPSAVGLLERYPSIKDDLTRVACARMVATYVATSSLFREMEEAVRRDVVTRFRLRRAAAGEALQNRGEKSAGLHIVLSGRLRSTADPDTTFGAGVVFGEREILSGEPVSESIQCTHETWVLRLPRAEFHELISLNPMWLERIVSIRDDEAKRKGAGV